VFGPQGPNRFVGLRKGGWVVGSNGALEQLQELGGLATSRLQELLGSEGAGLDELFGLSKITSSAPVRALVEIGGGLFGTVMERAAGGKEIEALKEIGGYFLTKLATTVQEVVGQMGDGTGSSLTSRFQEVGDMAMNVVQSTGLANGLVKFAEAAMGAIGSSRS
jgi:hypothetical protein